MLDNFSFLCFEESGFGNAVFWVCVLFNYSKSLAVLRVPNSGLRQLKENCNCAYKSRLQAATYILLKLNFLMKKLLDSPLKGLLRVCFLKS